MSRLVDLTIPFDNHIPRWDVKFYSIYNTTSYKATTINLSVHTATHLDSPLHYVPNGVSVADFPLEWIISEGMILDLSYKQENDAIEIQDLEPYFIGSDYPRVAILRTDWPQKYWGTMKYWEASPYLSAQAAEWLANKEIDIVGYDFPQDYVIRNIALGKAKLEDFVVHRILSENGIWQIEYMSNLHALQSDRAKLIICPLPLKGVEGSPARVLGMPI